MGLILLGALAGGLYGLAGPKDYSATAEVLVTPLPVGDTTFTGMDLFRETTTRRTGTAAANAAALLRSPKIADAVLGQLALKRSRESLLGQIHTHVVGSSNVVDVSVDDSNAGIAAQIANAFVSVLVSQRTASFLSQLASAIQRDQQVLNALPAAKRSGPEGAELGRRLAVLHSFEAQPDPTLRQAVQAAPPTATSGLGAGPVAGIGAGAGALAGLLVLLGFFVRDELRRRAAYSGPHYERRTFEQMAERLEGRVHERLDALAAEEERLVNREQEIAARERRVEARMEELRVAQESGLGGSDAHIRQLAEREDALDKREQEITTRHRELAAGLAELSRAREAADERLDALIAEEKRLAELEQAMAAREDDALSTLQELRQAQAPVDESRERELALREEELAARERALAAAKVEGEWGEHELAELAARETEFGRREAELPENAPAAGGTGNPARRAGTRPGGHGSPTVPARRGAGAPGTADAGPDADLRAHGAARRSHPGRRDARPLEPPAARAACRRARRRIPCTCRRMALLSVLPERPRGRTRRPAEPVRLADRGHVPRTARKRRLDTKS